MAKVADFLDYVSLHAADADEDILRFYIQEAVTDFLIDTKLAVDYHRFSMIDKVHDYVLDPPECHTIISIKSVRVGQRCEEVVDWRDLKETARREHWGYTQTLIMRESHLSGLVSLVSYQMLKWNTFTR